jgi:hypothetical protein
MSALMIRRILDRLTLCTAACLIMAGSAGAQQAPTLILLDSNAIAVGQQPTMFTAADVNTATADIGIRDALPYFNLREGTRVVLGGGSMGHEGWLAFTAAPATWVTAAGEDDALQSYWFSGPGLGAPDPVAGGSRTSKLSSVSQVVPLQTGGLAALVGRDVCAVAYVEEIPRDATGANLSGKTLGVLAFNVVSVQGGDGVVLPNIEVSVLDARTACEAQLTPMADAPQPIF